MRTAKTSGTKNPDGESACSQEVTLIKLEQKLRQIVFKIGLIWNLSDQELGALLGCAAERVARIRVDPDQVMTEGELGRSVTVFGVAMLLHNLYLEPAESDCWIRKPIAASPFDGGTPIELMTRNAEGLRKTEAYLQARFVCG